MTERMMPQNVDAEKCLLGSILIDPEAYVVVSDFLTAEDFYREAHRRVYEMIEYLVEREETPDYISICYELERRNIRLFNDDHNNAYLVSLINALPTSGNAEHYARIIEETAVRRRLINAAGSIAASAQEDTAEEAILTAENQILAVTQKRNISSYTPISDIVAICAQRTNEASENKSPMIGIPTGFVDLDNLLKGLRRTALYIIAARPGQGKTSLALALAFNAATREKKRIAFFSLEMNKEQLVFRMIALRAGVSSDSLQSGRIEQWDRVENAMSIISESSIVIDDTTNLSLAQLRSRCLQIKAKHGLDEVYVDYLQLLTATQRDGKALENRVQEISAISRGLKGLAKDLDVPVIALAQLSRAVEARQVKVPQLSDLRESGSIEADADVVIFIYRDEYYNPNSERKGQADLIIAKNREGEVGEVTLKFIKEYTRFANLAVNPDGSPVEDFD